MVLSLFLSSCSSPQKQPEIINPQQQEETATTSEAVFTYGGANRAKIIGLTLGAEPVPIKDGYIRLTGLLAGASPIACVEINGKGQSVAEKEEVNGYIVSQIKEKEVVLCLKK